MFDATNHPNSVSEFHIFHSTAQPFGIPNKNRIFFEVIAKKRLVTVTAA
jgi:hypothetical protein